MAEARRVPGVPDPPPDKIALEMDVAEARMLYSVISTKLDIVGLHGIYKALRSVL